MIIYHRNRLINGSFATTLFTGSKNLISKNPAIKPPICAAYATPPLSSPPSIPMPLITWNAFHKPNASKAGMDTMYHSTIACTFRVGYNNRYPPKTPEMAPEAPRLGISEF